MIAIPNMEKPEYCRVCHERLKCKQYDGEILHTPDDCPLIEIEVVRCGECEYADEYNHCKYSAWWNGNADFCSHGIRRKEIR